MNSRTDSSGSPPPRSFRWLVWGIVALAVIAGAVLAILLSPRITPLIDTIN